MIAADIKNNADTESVKVTVANFRPKVKSTIPTNGQINVPLNQHIRVVFSEPMDQNVALWQAITISPGVSGDWVWLNDKEIDFTPDPSFIRNTTYTVSLSSQLKDLQGQELIPYSFSFTTGTQPGADNPQGYPTAFHWESAEPASWLDLYAYPYIYQFEDFYFYGQLYSWYYAVKTGNIWFSTPRYDLHFDLPTAGGDNAGVIAAYNDSITITGLNQGWIRQIKKYNPDRKIIEWRYINRDTTKDTTSFEVTIFLNEYPGRFRYDYRKCDVKRFWNDGGSGISSGDGIHYFNITEKYGPVYTLAPASFIFTTDPVPGHPRDPAARYPLASEFVTLTWRQNPEPDLAGYIVYRRRGDSLSYRTLDTTVVNNFTDTLVQLGNTYIYRVTAIDTLGLESTYSDSVVVKYGPREVDNPLATAYNNGRKIVSSPTGDKVHLVYSSGGGIYYCYSQDSGKSFSSSELVGSPGEYPALAIDTSGDPCVSWVSGSYIYYTHWTASWAPPETIVLPVVNVSPPSMVCDTTDTVHLVFVQYYWLPSDTGDLIYIKFHKGHFQDAIIETLYTHIWARTPSLVIDNSRILHLLWQGERSICYQEKDSTGWSGIDTIYRTTTSERLYPVIDLYGNKIMTVWQDRDSLGNLEIYSRQKTEIGWQNVKKVATTIGESKFPTLSGGHYCLWLDNTSGNWEVYMSQYVDTSGSWTSPENISNTTTASVFPHSAYSLVNANNAKLYCLWTEGDTIPYTIKFKKLNVSPVAKVFVDLGQAVQSQYCLRRDGYWVFGDKPYQTTDWGYENLRYKFTGLDPEKVYRMDLAYYFENQVSKGDLGQIKAIGGNSGQIKAIEGNFGQLEAKGELGVIKGYDGLSGNNGLEVPAPTSREPRTVNRETENCSGAIHRTDGMLKQVQHDRYKNDVSIPEDERGIGRIIQALVVDGIGLDTTFITPNHLKRISVWLPQNTYTDGEIIIDISKVKGKRVVCSAIGLYEFPVEKSMVQKFFGPQGAETQLAKPFYFDRIYPNPTNGMIRLRFNSPDERKISIKIYDVCGRLMHKEDILKSRIGMNEVWTKPEGLSAGVYFVCLEAEGYEKIEKVVLLR
ncbi:MAG: Ig-like domain-containing protein [candidate division WOR-3 bacterium]